VAFPGRPLRERNLAVHLWSLVLHATLHQVQGGPLSRITGSSHPVALESESCADSTLPPKLMLATSDVAYTTAESTDVRSNTEMEDDRSNATHRIDRRSEQRRKLSMTSKGPKHDGQSKNCYDRMWRRR